MFSQLNKVDGANNMFVVSMLIWMRYWPMEPFLGTVTWHIRLKNIWCKFSCKSNLQPRLWRVRWMGLQIFSLPTNYCCWFLLLCCCCHHHCSHLLSSSLLMFSTMECPFLHTMILVCFLNLLVFSYLFCLCPLLSLLHWSLFPPQQWNNLIMIFEWLYRNLSNHPMDWHGKVWNGWSGWWYYTDMLGI